MGIASHRRERRREEREELSSLRARAAEAVATAHYYRGQVDLAAKQVVAWKRTIGGLIAQAGGVLVLADEPANSITPYDKFQVTHDDKTGATTFTLIRGGSDE